MSLLWFIIIIVVLAVLPWIREKLRLSVSESLRAAAPGDFANLSVGYTHYQWVGPVRGPVAVLVHGLTTPSAIWQEIAQGMVDLGYRVLVYDLYGRGFSDAPHGTQNKAFFVEQLSELLDDQGLDEELVLVGYSMGGAIATAFAAQYPHRVNRLVMLASTGVEMHDDKFWAFCRDTPVIGDWLHAMLGPLVMRAEINTGGKASPMLREAQLDELKRKGYLRSVLSSRRAFLSETLEDEHRRLGIEAVPVVAIWARKDHVIPITAIGQLASWNTFAQQDEVETAGHGLPYSHGPEVIGKMVTLFSKEIF
jgi:pimeloyl-ACP methyl ester carboxylesterase